MRPAIPQRHRSQPLLSLSIISHGDWRPLTALLETISIQEPIGRIQLIVTDNLRTDIPDLAPSNWHSILLLRPERPRGFAANHNAAFEQCTGSYFCVLNPDVQFTHSVLESLVQHLEAGEGHLAAPLLVDSRGDVTDSFRPLPTPWRILRRRLGRRPPLPVIELGAFLHPDWIAGTFMLMHRSTFADLGGFDARYRLYFEDVEFCTRLRLAGKGILVDPALRLLHDPRRQSRRPGMHLFWHLQSAVRFFGSESYLRARRLSRNA